VNIVVAKYMADVAVLNTPGHLPFGEVHLSRHRFAAARFPIATPVQLDQTNAEHHANGKSFLSYLVFSCLINSLAAVHEEALEGGID
jgi:hypothetical protein